MAKYNLFWTLTALAIIYIKNSNSLAIIEKSLLMKFEKAANGTKVNIFAVLESNSKVVDKINSMTFDSQDDQRQQLHSDLKSHASQYQANVNRFLASKKTKFQSFWIANQIYIPAADKRLIDELLQFNEIEEIKEEKVFKLDDPIVESKAAELPSTRISVQWGIQQIRADEVWNKSNSIAPTGKGIRVANIDMGVRWTHEALKDNYLGPYGWFDPYAKRPNRNDTPYDKSKTCHGTHTMGTIAGSSGVGVAPGSQWMACRGGNDDGWFFDFAQIACFQYILCPHLPDGSKPDCSKAPHVVSNSWGGGQGDTSLFTMMEALRTAGIIVVFSQGNSGPECGTAKSPGDLPNVIGVGATSYEKSMAWFSGRGPPINGRRIKPDISGPGLYVTSAYCTADNLYITYSGTSMACPHVAGVIGLMQATSGKKKFNLIKIKNALCKQPNRNVTKTGQNCGGVSDDVYPNNSFGCGIVDAFTAVRNIIVS